MTNPQLYKNKVEYWDDVYGAPSTLQRNTAAAAAAAAWAMKTHNFRRY